MGFVVADIELPGAAVVPIAAGGISDVGVIERAVGVPHLDAAQVVPEAE